MEPRLCGSVHGSRHW